jgi:glutamine cyclotransferase
MLSYKQREIRASVDASPGSKGPLAAPTLLATHVSFGQQRANTRAMDDTGHVQVTRERVLRQSAIPIYTYKIAQVYPHDRTLYTQGLVVESGAVYEGTGLYGQSKLRHWELHSGRILNEIDLEPNYFGEGITVLDGTIYQLTYLSNTCFTYDQRTLRRKERFRYSAQGWGLTNDGKQLLMSNGSSVIVVVDPKSFEAVDSIFVSDNNGPVGFLNDLQYADDKLYANVWQTDFIAIIAPKSGTIIGWIDLTGLNCEPDALVYPYVLNGIAYNKDTGRLLVTGKCWPEVYEIELVLRAAR